MKQYSIRQQVALLTLIPMLIMAIGMVSYFLHDRFKHMDEALLEKGELIAHQLAASSEYGVFSNNQEFLSNIADGVLQQPDVRGLFVFNSSMKTLLSAGKTSADSGIMIKSLANHASQLAFASSRNMDDAIILSSPASGDTWLIYHEIIPEAVIMDDGENKPAIKSLGAVIVEISKLSNEEHKTRLLWTSSLATILLLSLACYLAYLASRSITEPISKLSEAVNEIGAGRLDTRVLLTTRVRELSTLVHGLNETTENLQLERAGLQLRIDEATQALREKKEEAELASHDKSRFLAVASHDLRQPLHALGLYVAELQRKLSETEHQHLVEQIVNSIEAFSELLNALLDISKLDAGVIVPQIRIFGMNDMLNRIASDYQRMADDKNILMIVRKCNWCISSDPLLLERILVNLVSNAIRYTSQNGRIMVACRRRGNFLRIEVRDNGIGISQIDQGNIFREFYQVKQSRLESTKGLGLGLAIVDRLTKLLGHRIELRSTPNMGSVFALEVPLALRSGRPYMSAVSQFRPDVASMASESPLYGKRLLVVDDDPAVLSGTAKLLLSWGCLVSHAASLEQVRNLVRNGEKWDFIVSDYQLENDTNGIDVISTVRQHQNETTPCVLITGDTSQAVVDLAGMNGYPLLYKPIKPARLRSLITHLLEEDTRSMET